MREFRSSAREGGKQQSATAAVVGKQTLTDSLIRRSNVGAAAVDAGWRGVVSDANQTSGHAPEPGVAGRVSAATRVDVSGVRVHTGAASNAAASAISARAFAVGQDVHFAAGEYRPGTPDGDHLLAHELAHATQADGSPHAELTLGGADDAAEAEADAIADRAVAGPSACPTCSGAGCAACGDKPAAPVTRTAPVSRTIRRTMVRRDGTPPAGGAAAGAAGAAAGAEAAGAAGAAGAGAGAAAGAAAAAPGACSDPAEQTRKTAFRARTDLHLDNNIPSTGIGKFDAKYLPLTGLMPVTVKIQFDFVQADNTPGLLARIGRRLSGQSNDQFFWTEAQQNDYVNNFIANVSARWTAQHMMTSKKPCWTEFFAIPLITPVRVEDKAAAHFAVTVHKSSGPGIDYKSAVNNEHLTNPAAQPTADFWQSDNTEEPNFNSQAIATNERTRLQGVLASTGATPVTFAQDHADVPAPALGMLTAFASAANQANPSAPLVPIAVDGWASAEGDAAHNLTLSQSRAESVAAALRAAGIRQPVRATPRGPTGAPNDAANRRADISIDTTFETTYASNRYSVSQHEFGHMLGNPDEYSNATAGPLANVQTQWSALVTSAGLSVPTFGQLTSSQMSAGVDVLPSHYITLWEALGRMTTPNIQQNEWSLL